MYRFNYNLNTQSIYFCRGQYSTPIFYVDAYKVQEHILLYVCVELKKWLTSLLTTPSKSIITMKFEEFCRKAKTL